MKRFIIPSILLTIGFLLTSCNRDEIQAQKSLVGSWDVTAITSIYMTPPGMGNNPRDKVNEEGSLGTFEFTEDSVHFSFTRNDTLYAGNAAWLLDQTRVRQGFFRVNQFTLGITNQFLFDVTFEDQTVNSEKNATYMTFFDEPTEGEGVWFSISLEKR
ncbi:MAG: hypothetical protein AAFP89_19960 [Bacteroidota bacterium]